MKIRLANRIACAAVAASCVMWAVLHPVVLLYAVVPYAIYQLHLNVREPSGVCIRLKASTVNTDMRNAIPARRKQEHAMKTLVTTLAALIVTAGSFLPQAGHAAGNAHSAATAGMTYQGDPVSGPTSPLPQPPQTPQMRPSAKSQPAGNGTNPSMMQAAPPANGQ